jgi:hypothetical protein
MLRDAILASQCPLSPSCTSRVAFGTVCSTPLLHTAAFQNPSPRLLASSCRGISSKVLKGTGPAALWAAEATLGTAAGVQLWASHHSIATAADENNQGARVAAERYSGEVDAEGRKLGFGRILHPRRTGRHMRSLFWVTSLIAAATI